MTLLPIPVQDVAALSKRYKACCKRAMIFNADQILLTKPEELPTNLGLSRSEAEHVRCIAARTVAPKPTSILHLLTDEASADDDKRDDIVCNDAHDASGSDLSSPPSPSGQAASLISSLALPRPRGDDAHRGVSSGSDSASDAGSEGSFWRPQSNALSEHADTRPAATADLAATESDKMRGKRKAVAGTEPHPDGAGEASAGSRQSLPRCNNAEALYDGRPHHALTTGDVALDDLLNGGVFKGALTEISGESTSGKTQLAVQLAVYGTLGLLPLDGATTGDEAVKSQPSSTSPYSEGHLQDLATSLRGFGVATDIGSHCGVAYITSGGQSAGQAFVKRAVEVAEASIRKRFRGAKARPSEGASQQSAEDSVVARARSQLLANIHVACVNDVEALDHAVRYALPGHLARLERGIAPQGSFNGDSNSSAPVGLIVVDSLPGLFHDSSALQSTNSLVQRTRILVEISDTLKRLARPHTSSSTAIEGARTPSAGAAAVVLNHVSDTFGREKDIANRFVFSPSDRLKAAHEGGEAAGDAAQESRDAGVSAAVVALPYAEQGAFFNGLLASVPPTLAEALSLHEPLHASAGHGRGSAQLYSLQPKTSQLGHVWANSINVRIMLSKTRNRVAPDSAGTDCGLPRHIDASKGGPVKLVNVRRATVVFSSCGPSMLDPPSSTPVGTVRKRARVADRRHVRFVIRSDGIVSLKPYMSMLAEARMRQDADNLADGGGGGAEAPAASASEAYDDERLFETLDLDDEQLAALEMQLDVLGTPRSTL